MTKAKRKAGHFEMRRSGIQVGMHVVSDAWHVQWVSRYETHSVASFWIGELQSAEVAEDRARELMRQLAGAK
jgi:hypothetical protein